MRPLLKVMLVLVCIFASTFIVGRLLGILTVENVRSWLALANEIEAIYVIATVILLLFSDLFVAVPTLTITLLSGYFLGFPAGAMTAFVGMSCAAFTGYALSWRWGEKGIDLLVKDERQKAALTTEFQRTGPMMIVLSRAAPMIPEVTACMAGATRMAIWRYVLFFTISTVPYALIAAYAGSISSVNDPMPAIFASLLLYAVLWSCWFIYRRRRRNSNPDWRL